MFHFIIKMYVELGMPIIPGLRELSQSWVSVGPTSLAACYSVTVGVGYRKQDLSI